MARTTSDFPTSVDTFVNAATDFNSGDAIPSSDFERLIDAIKTIQTKLGITGGTTLLDGAVTINNSEADKDFRVAALNITNAFLIDGALGKVFLNDTSNAKATGPSITISGDETDGEYICLKDKTDVAAGFTTLTETDTFGLLTKAETSSGGLRVEGFKDADDSAGVAIYILGHLGEAADTTTTAAGLGVIQLSARILSGTTDGAVGAGGNLVAIDNAGTATAIFNQDGDLYLDTVVNENDWDEYNDAELVRAGRLMMRSNINPIKKQFMGIVNKHSDNLVKWKLINLNEDDPTHFMMGMKKWVMLNADTNWQNYESIQGLKRVISKIGEKLGMPVQELLALGS